MRKIQVSKQTRWLKNNAFLVIKTKEKFAVSRTNEKKMKKNITKYNTNEMR
jgi:hypothetical protein